MTNKEIRLQAFESGIKHWQIAAEIGVTNETFSKWLRTEISEEKKQQILQAIERLKAAKA